jgi:8-oxo-dGTP diphosphatase
MSTNETDQEETFQFAVDIVIFFEGNVLLVTRGKEPFKGCKVFPGGRAKRNEKGIATAVRELREETGLVIDPRALRPIDLRDDPDRDPRDRVISVVYAAHLHTIPGRLTAGDDAAAAAWFDIEEALREPLGFDHNDILANAYSLLLDDRL